MATVIYCKQDKELRQQVKKNLEIEYNHVFVSPTATGIDHSATRVIIVGNHPHIADRYKGIVNAEYYETDEPEPDESEEQ